MASYIPVWVIWIFVAILFVVFTGVVIAIVIYAKESGVIKKFMKDKDGANRSARKTGRSILTDHRQGQGHDFEIMKFIRHNESQVTLWLKPTNQAGDWTPTKYDASQIVPKDVLNNICHVGNPKYVFVEEKNKTQKMQARISELDRKNKILEKALARKGENIKGEVADIVNKVKELTKEKTREKKDNN